MTSHRADTPTQHPRDRVVEMARRALAERVDGIITGYGLTYAEIIHLLAGAIREQTGSAIRVERGHPA